MTLRAPHSGPDVASDFIEQFGLLTEMDGLPRIAGRIMALLLLSDEPRDASEIGDRLQVSHGSVSTNTRLLENLGILERVSVPGDRRLRFRITADPYGRLLAGHLQRQRRIKDLITDTVARLPARDAAARQRLARTAQFYALTIGTTEQIVEQWRAGAAAAGRPARRPSASKPRPGR